MNSAIIAVTKSAYATFHAPPRCLRAMTGLGRIGSGGAYCGILALPVARPVHLRERWNLRIAAERLFHLEETGPHLRWNGTPRVFDRQYGRRTARERDDRNAQH